MPPEEVIAALAARLKEAACAAHLTVATAESCTGGLIAGAITAVPGSSECFYGGIVSYDNSVKQNVLGVPESVLRTDGAVSAPCARAMAEGSRRLIGTDLAVSVTGIAGPDGGSAEKPVGTVWFGLASADGTTAEMRRFGGDRAAVRAQTVIHALELLLDAAGGERR